MQVSLKCVNLLAEMKKNRLIVPNTFTYNVVIQSLVMEQRLLASKATKDPARRRQPNAQLYPLKQPEKSDPSSEITKKVIQLFQEMKNSKKNRAQPTTNRYNLVRHCLALMTHHGDRYASSKCIELLAEMKASQDPYPDTVSYGSAMTAFMTDAKQGSMAAVETIEVQLSPTRFL